MGGIHYSSGRWRCTACLAGIRISLKTPNPLPAKQQRCAVNLEQEPISGVHSSVKAILGAFAVR